MFDAILNNDVFTRWVAVAVTVMFFATLVLVPMILIRLPQDYFRRAHRDRRLAVNGHPVLRLVFIVLKNAIGAVFVLLGIIMLVLPGQGVLTILVGLMLIDFPGKYEVEQWAVRHHAVERAINWIRNKARKPPLEI